MTTSDYLIDSVLVLLVLLQIKERRLTLHQQIRPIVVLGIAVLSYLHGIPTGGNDLLLAGALLLLGATIGGLSGQTVQMRTDADGDVLTRARWLSGFFWVLGMGSRMAFAIWSASSAGGASVGHFSALHSITSAEAWTVGLLAMAAAEVLGRTAVVAIRAERLRGSRRTLQFA
jgi:hypothetical protein